MAKGRDRLTGLLDRNGGYAIAGQRVSEALLGESPLAVLWIDIDRFHQVNHSFGHSGGDQLVKEVARRIELLAASHGEIARMSGDEFVLIVPGTAFDATTAMAGELRAALGVPFEIDGVQIRPTVSIGIAFLEAAEDAVRFLLRADRAKTLAKEQGGDRFVVSGERLAHSGYRLVRQELEIEAKLHEAMDSGGLQLYYQPIVRPDGSVEAVEALMRCQVGGVWIPPAQFIPVAEKTGMITRLGEWTMYEGAAVARRLSDAGHAIKVAVNVSRAQLGGPRFLQSLHSALLCANIPPHLLELELTESLLLDTSPAIQANLLGAREVGVGMAIDDFGTGYSSLSTLKDVPATKLKLDRSFILSLPDDWKAMAVVRTVAALGRELGLTVVAEGVETERQLRCLQNFGIDAIQGYIHSPAVPLNNLIAWLSDPEKCRPCCVPQ